MKGKNRYPGLGDIKKINPEIIRFCGVTNLFLAQIFRGFKAIKPINQGTKENPNWKHTCRIDGRTEIFSMVTNGFFAYAEIQRKPLFILSNDPEWNNVIYIKLF